MELTAQKEMVTGEKGPMTALELETYTQSIGPKFKLGHWSFSPVSTSSWAVSFIQLAGKFTPAYEYSLKILYFLLWALSSPCTSCTDLVHDSQCQFMYSFTKNVMAFWSSYIDDDVVEAHCYAIDNRWIDL